MFRLTTASLVVVAAELSLQWNNINNVYDASTAAQLIPIILASGLLTHVFWVFLIKGQVDDGDSESSTTSVTVEEVEVIVD